MISKCLKTDESKIIAYIGKDYPSCLYLYLDLLKYGLESDTISVYIQTENNEIEAILLKYYSCLHVYSRNKAFDAHELVKFFCNCNFTMLYSTADTAENVYLALPQEIKNKATFSRGWVAQIQHVDHKPRGLAVAAERNDFDQIVRLIYDDEDIGRSYKFEELARQMEERNQQGYARNLVIKEDKLVIAHACTNAELNGIAVVGELLVRKEYRRKGYASEIWREICSQLLVEGNEVFSFYYSDESRTLHKHIGFYEVCEWVKIIIS